MVVPLIITAVALKVGLMSFTKNEPHDIAVGLVLCGLVIIGLVWRRLLRR
jgi:hypothetical protein